MPVLGGANGDSHFFFRFLKENMAKDLVVERIWDPKLFLRLILIKLMMEIVTKE